MDNCQLYIQHELVSNSIGFITITYDPEADLTIGVTHAFNESMTIETDEIALTYVADYDKEGVFFSLKDKLSGECKILGFDLRYWQSF